jgi:hypothetical protein
MKFWIASFLVLFSVAELFQWLKHFTLPLPIYILGGAFLAIASNYDRRSGFPFRHPNDEPAPPVMRSVTQHQASQIKSAIPQPSRPLSFTIQRSHPEIDSSEINP